MLSHIRTTCRLLLYQTVYLYISSQSKRHPISWLLHVFETLSDPCIRCLCLIMFSQTLFDPCIQKEQSNYNRLLSTGRNEGHFTGIDYYFPDAKSIYRTAVTGKMI